MLTQQMLYILRTMEEFHNQPEMATTHTNTVSETSRREVVQDLKVTEVCHLVL